MQLPFYVEFRQTSKGYLQIEFYDNNPDFWQFYDITKLIVDRQPLNIKGRQVYNCAVSWYRRDACIMFDEKLTEVLAEIVLELLQSDPNYCYSIMKNLLNKQRVEIYLERGLQETPFISCGKYIGGIKSPEKGYNKFFCIDVGLASHNSELMINRRQEHRQMLEAQEQRNIAYKKAEIERLQREIVSMEK